MGLHGAGRKLLIVLDPKGMRSETHQEKVYIISYIKCDFVCVYIYIYICIYIYYVYMISGVSCVVGHIFVGPKKAGGSCFKR